MLKRLFDIVVAMLVLACVWPVVLLAAGLIKVLSPGPAFYMAVRVGKNGAVFNMVKLRSMHVSSATGPAITAPDDSRIFPFGGFLRRAKIDELPQFWNVLRGDMSIVGPRPEDPQIVKDHYTGWMRKTLDVRPGITSPGAIFGYLQGDSLLKGHEPERAYIARLLPEKLRIELDYVENRSFWADIGIIFATARAILYTLFHARAEL